MSNTRELRFQQLAERFEALARDLGNCRDPNKRKEYFLRMKAVIKEVDELVLRGHPNSDSKASATVARANPNARAE